MAIKESLEREKVWNQILMLFGWELVISQDRDVRFLIDKHFYWLEERARVCKQGAEPCFRQKKWLLPCWSVTNSLTASNMILDFDPRSFAFCHAIDSCCWLCRHHWCTLRFQILALPISWDIPNTSIRSASRGTGTVFLHWLMKFKRSWIYNQNSFLLLFKGVVNFALLFWTEIEVFLSILCLVMNCGYCALWLILWM